MVTATAALGFVHVGAFSGSATSLRDALAQLVTVQAIDLLPEARNVRLLPSRLRALGEAAARGHSSWTKTGTWSAALQRRLEAAGMLDAARPLLVVQSVPALVLGERVRYAVYTDRVGLEGAADGSAHRSHVTPRWLGRERALLRGADAVFVMGPSTQAALVERYGVPEHRVEVVGAGPNTAMGAPRRRVRCRRLLFVGVDWERKGGPTLLEAFARVHAELPDLELAVAGGGPPDPVPPGVVRLGRVPHAQVEQIFDDADVLVLPTRMEAFGIVLVEALFKGLPCVHSTVGNQAWIVADAGEAVPPDDASALAAALRRVVTEFPIYHEHALLRGAKLRDAMSWSVIAERIAGRLLS